ncbi:hypothetical protein NQ314_017162 [Rhamnusium bicolor]|uniref:Inorganic pyrophosphatase n=1 Tax=Rhamnusium bicolor TaxID=1586634 RepID=A0AAV8WV10_9CUCU|nr:hypothetical protein NQ314_017162 [Rhamnusium bicolor]
MMKHVFFPKQQNVVTDRWCNMLAIKLPHVFISGLRKNLTLCRLSSRIAGVLAVPASNNRLNMAYSIIERGSPYSADYRVYIQDKNGPVSPLHDIPLVVDPSKKTFNMVVEVPRWTNAKMEITMKEILNPIKQDIKKGKPRFVSNSFPHHGYIWNYGALPQTWENPEHLDDGTGCKGDNDPIDVIEIGYRVAKRGEILQVKILGTIALIDEDQINDVSDIEKHFPGLLKASVEWFKIYKIPDGKPENQFAFNGEAKPAAFAHKIIDEVHKFWKALVSKEVDAKGISCVNTTLDGNSFKISVAEAKEVINKTPEYGPAQPLDAIGWTSGTLYI